MLGVFVGVVLPGEWSWMELDGAGVWSWGTYTQWSGMPFDSYRTKFSTYTTTLHVRLLHRRYVGLVTPRGTKLIVPDHQCRRTRAWSLKNNRG